MLLGRLFVCRQGSRLLGLLWLALNLFQEPWHLPPSVCHQNHHEELLRPGVPAQAQTLFLQLVEAVWQELGLFGQEEHSCPMQELVVVFRQETPGLLSRQKVYRQRGGNLNADHCVHSPWRALRYPHYA